MADIILSTQNGEPVASSRQIAESFGKEHKDTLESIRQILAAENSATKSMFYETTFENRGKQYPMYLMNRDGFTLLAMGFTGKAALEWKLKYIQAFNEMEKQLAQRPQLSRAELMAQALIAAHDELEHKDRKIAELTPKGIFADAVNSSKKRASLWASWQSCCARTACRSGRTGCLSGCGSTDTSSETPSAVIIICPRSAPWSRDCLRSRKPPWCTPMGTPASTRRPR